MKNKVKGLKLCELTSYSDAGFAADKLYWKLITGGAISFERDACELDLQKKQGRVSSSTMEAKFKAASEATREMLEICEMYTKIGVLIKLPIPMHMNNRAAIKLVERGGAVGESKAYWRAGEVSMRICTARYYWTDIISLRDDNSRRAV